MSNVIIIVILSIMILLGTKETVKHFKGEGVCCGGGSVKHKKKKLKNKVLYAYSFQVKGIHCQNCVNAVIRAVNDIDGASAKVNLRKGIVRVLCDREIDEDIIKAVITKRGYEVI